MKELVMSKKLFADYMLDPVGMNEAVRRDLGIPNHKYFSVTTYPPERAGVVVITGDRVVTSKKVSKSDQQS